ncbi:hypothetical protein P0136_06680 [Lentisphaerota bacterium ZTH]|nr:hypothetical protein JYG24_02210 [Lentisphaerota bacterium]WET07675.1 hypothetical protein P0136_06680 [Lentisphaerota bacterium ZTH]
MDIKASRNSYVYLATIVAAFSVRTVLFGFWLYNPLRFYNQVAGLDMQTLVNLGARLYNGETTFTLHKLALAAAMLFNKGRPWPDAVIVVQLLMGIAVALLTAWCVLRLKGDRAWATASGILAALYAPALIYQVVILKEAFLTFFAVLALAGLLWSHRKNFSGISVYIAGVLLALPCLCRVTALPFAGLASLWIALVMIRKLSNCKKTVQKLLIKMSLLALGVFSVFIPASVLNYNLTNGSQLLPFNLNIKYAFNLGSVQDIKTLDVPATQKTAKSLRNRDIFVKGLTFIENFIRKVPLIFQAREIPNNLNYYFIKPLLPPLNYMIGPYLLLPLAVTGLIMLIFGGRFFRAESIILVFIVAYILPICFFYPLGRYRLVLYPVFCMVAPYPLLYAIDKWRSGSARARKMIALPAGIYFTALVLTCPSGTFIRASDFVSHGKAAAAGHKNPAAGLPYFLAAYKKSPENQSAVINLTETLMQMRKNKEALAVVYKAHMQNPDNPAFKYYSGMLLLINRKYFQAEAVLKKLAPESLGKLRINYFYMLGEAARMQQRPEVALNYYKAALAANPAPDQRKLIEQLVSNLQRK